MCQFFDPFHDYELEAFGVFCYNWNLEWTRGIAGKIGLTRDHVQETGLQEKNAKSHILSLTRADIHDFNF